MAPVQGEGIILGRTALLGTYRDWVPEAGQMKLFVLMGDGTYHREFAVKCTQLWCRPGEDDGTWEVWRHGRETFVSLFPPTGRWEMYQATLVDDGLRLEGLDDEQMLTRTDQRAWCDVPRQCSLQDLPAQLTCLPTWACERHLCKMDCPAIVPPELTE